MKINYFIWNYKKCGGNKIVFEHANRLLDKGHTVRIFSVINSPVNWFNLRVASESFWSFKWLRKTDVAIATFWPTAFLLLLSPSKRKYYFVQNWEAGFYTNPLLSWLVGISLRMPLRIITISNFLKKKISTVTAKNIEIIPNAIDLNVFRPNIELKNKRRKKRVLSVISSYDYFKGMDDLVKLIVGVKKTVRYLEFILISFEIESYSKVFDYFISNPSQDILVKEYQKADIFLITPRFEGFPLPTMEAMACGVPVITTDSGGVNEYGTNNLNCLIAKNYIEIETNNLVGNVLSHASLRNCLIAGGYSTVTKYSWENIINKLEVILRG